MDLRYPHLSSTNSSVIACRCRLPTRSQHNPNALRLRIFQVPIASLMIVWLLSCPARPLRAATVDGVPQPLSLAQAEDLLRQYSTSLQTARLAVDAAAADSVTAGEAPNPEFSFNASQIDYRRGIGSGPPWDKQVDSVLRIDQIFERGGKRALRRQAAAAAERATNSDLADMWRIERLALAYAYYDLKLAEDAERVSSTLLGLQTQSLAAAQLRLKDGDVAAVDVGRLEIEVARSKADVSAARNARRTAQLVLSQTMGVAPLAIFTAVDDWPSPPDNVDENITRMDATVDNHLDNRPDVQAAAARNQQAEAELALARSQRKRDITIGLQYERLPDPPNNNINTVGVGFSFPLFLRHRYEGEIQRAAADRRTAAEMLRAVRLTAESDRTRAAADLAGAIDRVRQFQNGIVDKAKTTAESAEYAYAHGALDLADLLDARRTLQSISLDAIAARAAYAKASAAWRAAGDFGAVDTDLPLEKSKP